MWLKLCGAFCGNTMNSLCVVNFLLYIKSQPNLYFISFIDIDLALIVGNLLLGRLESAGLTYTCKSPGHQQAWYWPRSQGRFRFMFRSVHSFQATCQLQAEVLNKEQMQIILTQSRYISYPTGEGLRPKVLLLRPLWWCLCQLCGGDICRGEFPWASSGYLQRTL